MDFAEGQLACDELAHEAVVVAGEVADAGAAPDLPELISEGGRRVVMPMRCQDRRPGRNLSWPLGRRVGAAGSEFD